MRDRGFLWLAALCFAIALCLALVLASRAEGPEKGVSALTTGCDLDTLGASWWFSWWPVRKLPCNGWIPMVPHRGVTLSYSTSTDWVMEANEPNLPEQGNMTLAQLAEHMHYVETQRPNGRIVSPGLYPYERYTYTDVVLAYRQRYGHNPRWAAVAVHGYANEPDEILAWIDWVSCELDEAGIDAPIWLTEFGSWPGSNRAGTLQEHQLGIANVAEYVMRGVVEGLRDRPRVARYAWFPARPIADSAGVGWEDTALVTDAGRLTALGRVYAGY